MRETQFFYNETNAKHRINSRQRQRQRRLTSSGYSSIASIGFGLTALTIADERGWLSHAAAYQRAMTTLNFLYNTGASVNGFFYHFLNPVTGARSPGSELSSVDTAELMAGVVSVGQYWAGTSVQHDCHEPVQPRELAVDAAVRRRFLRRVDAGEWILRRATATSAKRSFSICSVLAPRHIRPLRSSWNSWSRSPSVNYASYHFITADDAALFTVQYPMAWFDMRGLSDSARD